MNADFNFLSLATLLGAAQGAFLALALFNTGSGDRKANGILAVFTLLFSIDLAEEHLYQNGFFDSLPDLLHVLAPIDLLYGPLIYLYIRQLTLPESMARGLRIYRHFIPFLLGYLLLSPFYLLDASAKAALTDDLRKGAPMPEDIPNLLLIESGLTLFILGTITQLGLYLLFSIRRLVIHARAVKNEFSDVDRISLTWLRNLLLGLVCICLLYFGDQFFPDLMGVNLLGDSITVVAVILIYAMGYLGLRQPVIFTAAPVSARNAQSHSPRPAAHKYHRSGLDEQTSLVFVDELNRHMETRKPYLQGDLVLPQLADQLGISANYLSQIINQQHGVNFYDFINGYRVEEARRLIRERGEQRMNVLQIALDSGFNSKSAFYTAFKKATSQTPTQYRDSL